MIVIGIFDILIEVALVGATAFMVAGLQAAIWTKCTVVTVFSFRLPYVQPSASSNNVFNHLVNHLTNSYRLIVFTAMRIVRWDQAALTTNFTLDEDMYIVWTQIQIYYSLVSATIPSLRPFINNLSTHYGVGLTPNDQMTYGSSSLSANRSGRRYGTSKSIQLSNMSSSHRRRLEEESAIRKETRDPTFAGSNETHVYAKGNNGGLLHSGPSQIASRGAKSTDEASVGSNDSQRMIIRKDTQWVVERANVDMI